MFFNFTDSLLAQDTLPFSNARQLSPLLPFDQNKARVFANRYILRMPNSEVQMDELELSNSLLQINSLNAADVDCAHCQMISNQTENKKTKEESIQCLKNYYSDFFQIRIDGLSNEMLQIQKKLESLNAIQDGLSKEVDYKTQYRAQLLKQYRSNELVLEDLKKLYSQSIKRLDSDDTMPSFKSLDALNTYLLKIKNEKKINYDLKRFDKFELTSLASTYMAKSKNSIHQNSLQKNSQDTELNAVQAKNNMNASDTTKNKSNTFSYCDDEWSEKDNLNISMSRLEDFLRLVDLPKNITKIQSRMDQPKNKKLTQTSKDPSKLLVNYPDLFMQIKANPILFSQLLAKDKKLRSSFEDQMNEVASLVESKDSRLLNPNLAKYFYLLYLRDYKKQSLNSKQSDLLSQLQDQFLESDSNRYKNWFEKINIQLGQSQCKSLASNHYKAANDSEVRLSFFESEIAIFDLNIYRNSLQDLSNTKNIVDQRDVILKKEIAAAAFDIYKNRKCMSQVQRYSFEEDPERLNLSNRGSVYSIGNISDSKILNKLSAEEKKVFFSDTSSNLNFLFRQQPESQNSFECVAFTISNEMQKVKVKENQVLQSQVVSGMKVHEIISTKILKKDISLGVEYNDLATIFRSLEKPNPLGIQNNNIQSFTPSYNQKIDTNSLRRALDKAQSLVVMTDTDTRRYVGGVVQFLPGKTNHISQMIGYDSKFDYNYGLSRNVFIFRDSINNNSNADVYIPEDYIRSSTLQVTILP